MTPDQLADECQALRDMAHRRLIPSAAVARARVRLRRRLRLLGAPPGMVERARTAPEFAFLLAGSRLLGAVSRMLHENEVSDDPLRSA